MRGPLAARLSVDPARDAGGVADQATLLVVDAWFDEDQCEAAASLFAASTGTTRRGRDGVACGHGDDLGPAPG